MTDMTIANEIRNQIGNKALYMLGAKDLVGDEKSLRFKIRGSRKVNCIRVTLNALDLYDVEYMKMRKFECKEVAKDEDIYADMLNASIERNTGLYTSM